MVAVLNPSATLLRKEPRFAPPPPSTPANSLSMKNTTQIDLNQPFERVVAAVLSLPAGSASSDKPRNKAELTTLVRGLYEAANGRHVETVLGRVPIAPPVAEFLKAKPFKAASQADFAIEVAARMISGPSHSVSNRSAKELIYND
jgi:hypothetical protein